MPMKMKAESSEKLLKEEISPDKNSNFITIEELQNSLKDQQKFFAR